MISILKCYIKKPIKITISFLNSLYPNNLKQRLRVRFKRRYSFILQYWKTSRALTRLLVLVLSEIAYAYSALQLTEWHKHFFNLLQKGDAFPLHIVMIEFLIFCSISFLCYSISVFMTEYIAGKWRQSLVNSFVKLWLESEHFSHPKVMHTAERIEEDFRYMSRYVVKIFKSVLRSILMLITLSPILWNISAELNLFPGFLFWIALGLALLSTVGLQLLFGRRTTRMWNKEITARAELRDRLTFIAFNTEQIKLFKGEDIEKQSLRKFNTKAVMLRIGLAKMEAIFEFIKNMLHKFGAISGYFILAPFYFVKKISYGVMSQATSVFFYISDALSVFATNALDFAYITTQIDRLEELNQAIHTITQTQLITSYIPGNTLIFKNLNIYTPDSENIEKDLLDEEDNKQSKSTFKSKNLFLSKINISIQPGERVLIMGDVGIGKTTFFRTISGTWPWAKGEIQIPATIDTSNIKINKVSKSVKQQSAEHSNISSDSAHEPKFSFIAQNPYIPILDNIEDIISYPNNIKDHNISDSLIMKALEDVQLDISLKDNPNTLKTLSNGEKQKLNIARLIIQQEIDPVDYVFMDEPYSALPHTESIKLMNMLYSRYPNTTFITISHQDFLKEHHGNIINMNQFISLK